MNNDKRQLTPDTLAWLEMVRGHIIYVSSILLGLSILFSGLTGRLDPVNSWKLVERVFGTPLISNITWSSVYIIAGVIGEYAQLVKVEHTRNLEVAGSSMIGLTSFVMFVFLVLAWVDQQTIPIWAVIFLYMCANGTARAIANLRQLA